MNIVKLLKLWPIATKIERVYAMENQSKPGWKTTEFWLTVLAQAPAAVGIFLGASNPITLALGAASTIAYTLGRNWSKQKAQELALAALKGAEAKAQELPK